MSTVQNERDVIMAASIQRLNSQQPHDITLSGRGVSVNVNNLTKPTTGPSGWTADAFSQQNSTQTAYCSALPAFNNKEVVFGLNQDPATDTGFGSIDYAWHLHSDGTISILESGTVISLGGGTAGSPGGGSTTPTPSGPVVLDYYGSSFVAGYNGATGGGTVPLPVPEYVDSRTNNLTVHNYGVNSSSTVRALNGTNGSHPAWSLQMENTTANWVIIQYLFNDHFDITPTQFRFNLRQMYNEAVSSGKQVIFQTDHYVDPLQGNPEASGHLQAMLDEAASLGIQCINTWAYTKSLWASSVRTYLPDGYHPTQSAYNTIGEYVTNQLLTFILGITGVGGTPPANPYPQTGVIAYWGTSLTLGLDAGFNQGFIPPTTTFDNDLNNFTVSNEGVSDNTTTRTLNGTDSIHTPLGTWLDLHPFHYFICELGLNDEYIDGGISVDQYGINLEAIVDLVRAAGQIIIFETCNETAFEARLAPYRTKMMNIATLMSVPVIDQFTYLRNYGLANGLQLLDMFPNGYHPTQEVYTLKGHYAATRFKEIIGAN